MAPPLVGTLPSSLIIGAIIVHLLPFLPFTSMGYFEINFDQKGTGYQMLDQVQCLMPPITSINVDINSSAKSTSPQTPSLSTHPHTQILSSFNLFSASFPNLFTLLSSRLNAYPNSIKILANQYFLARMLLSDILSNELDYQMN